MKVFLSWSGNSSKLVAISLRDWLKRVIQSCEPWVSLKDIGAGRRWSGELANGLEGSNFGIICLTKENFKAPWILFETGALAKLVKEAHVCPYLIDLDFTDLVGSPLKEFQGKKAAKEPTFELVEAMNDTLDDPLEPQVLRETFDQFWPHLESKISEARSQITSNPPSRTTDEILEDLILELRGMKARLGEVERSFAGRNALSPVRPTESRVFTRSDVLDAFSSLPDFGRESVEANVDQCMDYLRRFGVRNREQLFGLAGSPNVIEWLRQTYREILLREGEYPLDPLAVATWGAYLYTSGMKTEVQQDIVKRLKGSQEYRTAHKDQSARNNG